MTYKRTIADSKQPRFIGWGNLWSQKVTLSLFKVSYYHKKAKRDRNLMWYIGMCVSAIQRDTEDGFSKTNGNSSSPCWLPPNLTRPFDSMQLQVSQSRLLVRVWWALVAVRHPPFLTLMFRTSNKNSYLTDQWFQFRINPVLKNQGLGIIRLCTTNYLIYRKATQQTNEN